MIHFERIKGKISFLSGRALDVFDGYLSAIGKRDDEDKTGERRRGGQVKETTWDDSN